MTTTTYMDSTETSSEVHYSGSVAGVVSTIAPLLGGAEVRLLDVSKPTQPEPTTPVTTEKPAR